MDQTVSTWILGIVLILIQCALTTAVGLIIKKKWDSREKESKELEDLREEKRRIEEIKRFKDMQESIHKEFEPVVSDIDLMKKAMQKDIRRSLRQDASHYLRRGWASHQEKTEYDELYWCYHYLGKNGVIDNDHKKVMALPELQQGE